MQTRTVKPLTGVPPAETFSTSLKMEEDDLYLSEGIGGTHWFWQSLSAPSTKQITATLSSFHPGKAQLQIALSGETTGQHVVNVSVNDKPTGTAKWQGQSLYAYRTDATNLTPGENVITLEVPGEGDTVDVVLLDSITVNYASEFMAAGGVLEFGGAQDFRLRGFQSGGVSLYDISDAENTEKLEGYSETVSSTLAFHDDLPGRRYLATAAAFKKPEEIRIARSNNLLASDQQADYLVIAPASFGDALQPLLQFRSAHGLKARFVDVELVYDVFSDGVQDPQAIRDFVSYTNLHWAKPGPRFVLLAGKASYDYRDNLNGPNRNLVPTFLVPAPDIGEAASDDWFVASSPTDPHPAMAVGRIPAKTPEQLRTVIDKTMKYSSEPTDADWRRRAVFVTDKEDPYFDRSASALVSGLPKSITTKEIYLSAFRGDLAQTRSEIIREWNAGALLLTYIGHGSIDTWAAGPLFSAENVPGIENGSRLPILLTPTCLDGFFYHPQKDSLAEDLLFAQKGGIVAGLVPTGLSVPQAQDVLINSLFSELFANPAPTLGEAIVRAKKNLDANSPDTREVLETFVLLGDPALQWVPPR